MKMKIYHSFPRRTSILAAASKTDAAIEILRSIVDFGLLCTPERMPIPPAKATDNKDKQALLLNAQPEIKIVQSRFCATLCRREELFDARVRGVTMEGEEGARVAHSTLFGPIAVGFDPLGARRLGFVPTLYYTRKSISGLDHNEEKFPNQIDLIQRLKEIRDVLIVLSYIEAGIDVDGYVLPDKKILNLLEIDLPYEEKIMSNILKLRKRTRRYILDKFNTDREMALNLVGSVEVLLSLFQEADSSLDETYLAFFEQREWRIVHQMRPGTLWYCLGAKPDFQNPHAERMQREIQALRRLITRVLGPRPKGYFDNTWVLAEIDGLPAAAYIDEVVVPREKVRDVQEILNTSHLQPEIVVAQEVSVL